jgi:hypothetical protein
MDKLKINKLAKAVVLKDGLIQCITTSNTAIKRALASSTKQGHPEAEAKNVIVLEQNGLPTAVRWEFVDDNGQTSIACTRDFARKLKKTYGGKIVRKEYLCISSEVVS